MERVITIILGGGKGTRLYPLTKERAKPAVPFGGKYRLIDISMSNSINSAFKQIYILTQFNSVSLHHHLSTTYQFDSFTDGFVEILAAEQTFERSSWYEGTADAVRKNFLHFNTHEPTHYIILSGDQLYRMNLREMFRRHLDSGADITLAATPVNRERASTLGIIAADANARITGFREKPGTDGDISNMRAPAAVLPAEHRFEHDGGSENETYLGSMGMYIFNAGILASSLNNSFTDFGREVIPRAIERNKVFVYVFGGYWEDIGTIRSFYTTNIDLASPSPAFNFYDERMPIYTHRKHLPATKVTNCSIYRSLTAEGSILTEASICSSVIGIRTVIEEETTLDGVICLGANAYETPDELRENAAAGIPRMGIGRGSIIKRAIIDVNSRIGRGCRIGVDPMDRPDGDHGTHFVRDGIIVIPKASIVPDGTVM